MYCMYLVMMVQDPEHHSITTGVSAVTVEVDPNRERGERRGKARRREG